MAMNTYSDPLPRTLAHNSMKYLQALDKKLVMYHYGVMDTQPKMTGKTFTKRRWLEKDADNIPLVDGVTPPSDKLEQVDVVGSLNSYGKYVTITDDQVDYSEDELIKIGIPILSRQGMKTVELNTGYTITRGTVIRYANGVVALGSVDSKIVDADLEVAIMRLKTKEVPEITEVIKASTGNNTYPIPSGYICICDTLCLKDIKALTGFKNWWEYANLMMRRPNEAGMVNEVRFVTSNIIPNYGAVGAAGAATYINDGTHYYVYPYVIFGAEFFTVVPLAGYDKPIIYVVTNGNKGSDSDPLAQRNKVGWKIKMGSAILDDDRAVTIKACVTKTI